MVIRGFIRVSREFMVMGVILRSLGARVRTIVVLSIHIHLDRVCHHLSAAPVLLCALPHGPTSQSKISGHLMGNQKYQSIFLTIVIHIASRLHCHPPTSAGMLLVSLVYSTSSVSCLSHSIGNRGGRQLVDDPHQKCMVLV